MCGMEFDLQREFDDHNSSIHGMQKIECSECAIIFNTKEELLEHNRKVHKA